MQGSDISTNIRRCIETADIILVDITHRNASVMYELGYTHAIGKPVILLAAEDEDIPFDVANYRIIIFDGSVKGLEVLRSRLSDAIKDIRKKVISKKMTNWMQVVSEAMSYSDIVKLFIRLIP
jgi:nucleoside 2-deoxyribosyltransferase